MPKRSEAQNLRRRRSPKRTARRRRSGERRSERVAERGVGVEPGRSWCRRIEMTESTSTFQRKFVRASPACMSAAAANRSRRTRVGRTRLPASARCGSQRSNERPRETARRRGTDPSRSRRKRTGRRIAEREERMRRRDRSCRRRSRSSSFRTEREATPRRAAAFRSPDRIRRRLAVFVSLTRMLGNCSRASRDAGVNVADRNARSRRHAAPAGAPAVLADSPNACEDCEHDRRYQMTSPFWVSRMVGRTSTVA